MENKADCSGFHPDMMPTATDEHPVTKFGALMARIKRITERGKKRIPERPGYAKNWADEEWERRFHGAMQPGAGAFVPRLGNRAWGRSIGHRPTGVEKVKLARAHTRRTSKSPSKMKFVPAAERQRQQRALDQQRAQARYVHP